MALAAAMAEARAAEYRGVRAQAEHVATGEPSDAERSRALRRLRGELRRVRRRDFFPPAERDAAVAAVEQLARHEAGRQGAQPVEAPR